VCYCNPTVVHCSFVTPWVCLGFLCRVECDVSHQLSPDPRVARAHWTRPRRPERRLGTSSRTSRSSSVMLMRWRPATDMRDKITAEKGDLRNELSTAREKVGENTRPAITTPSPRRQRQCHSDANHPNGSARGRIPRTNLQNKCETPSLRRLSCTLSMQGRASRPLGFNRRRPYRNLPAMTRRDGGEMEEDGGKEEREREREQGQESRNTVRWRRADIARGGRVSVTVFIGESAGYTKPKPRLPVGKGTKKQQGHHRPVSSSMAG
jgi:hypothetical protein